jgi:hypothetical protein
MFPAISKVVNGVEEGLSGPLWYGLDLYSTGNHGPSPDDPRSFAKFVFEHDGLEWDCCEDPGLVLAAFAAACRQEGLTIHVHSRDTSVDGVYYTVA